VEKLGEKKVVWNKGVSIPFVSRMRKESGKKKG